MRARRRKNHIFCEKGEKCGRRGGRETKMEAHALLDGGEQE